MTTEVFGWTGRILSVDLSESKFSGLETMAYADRFLGGRGVATRIYWEEVSPETGALDPKNRFPSRAMYWITKSSRKCEKRTTN